MSSSLHLPTFLLPLLFINFAGMWLLIGWILGRKSGWSALAKRFPAGERPPDRALHRQVVAMGSVPESGVTDMVVAPQGLYLYRILLFRFGHRPLFIPWHAVSFVAERKMHRRRTYEIDLGGMSTVRVKDEAFKAIAPYIAQSLSPESKTP